MAHGNTQRGPEALRRNVEQSFELASELIQKLVAKRACGGARR